jgi:hypothetical protein
MRKSVARVLDPERRVFNVRVATGTALPAFPFHIQSEVLHAQPEDSSG